MPQIQSRRKDVRQAEKRRLRNRELKKAIKIATKAAVQAGESENPEQAEAALAAAYKVIDKAAKARVLHANTAARKKSQLAKKVASLQ